jgi:hypothetical protein
MPATTCESGKEGEAMGRTTGSLTTGIVTGRYAEPATPPSPPDAQAVEHTRPFRRSPAIRKDAYQQTPDPKVMIALGDCAITCGLFKGSYAVTGPVEKHVPVDVRIPGCPPRPAEILQALATLRQGS